jgi:hypothetical protein
MFHGHRAVIRTKVWREIGGFPTIISEDLGFSTLARERGYRGKLAHGVVCEEEFPQSYEIFTRRHLKYTRGAVEHLRRGMWTFICSPKICWFEKLDRLVASLAMVSAFPLLLFILDISLLLPLYLGQAWLAAGPLATRIGDRGASFNVVIYVMTIITLLAPLIPAVIHLRNAPAKLCRYIAASIAVHLSLVVRQACETCKFVLFRESSFPVTGDRSMCSDMAFVGSSGDVKKALGMDLIGMCGSFALIVASGSIRTALLPVFLALIACVATKWLDWNHVVSRMLVVLPVLAITFLIILHCLALVGLCGSLIPTAFASLYYYG